MSHLYYYLVASLPLLQFGSKLPFSPEYFLELCQDKLTAQDYFLIRDIVRKDEWDVNTNNDFYLAWKQFSHSLRNEMAWLRALELNKDPQTYLRGPREGHPFFVDIFVQASKSSDPLTAERIIDRFRWQYIDELARFHYFDLEALVAYAIKLKILVRQDVFESSQGKEIFDQEMVSAQKACEDILK